MTKNTATDITFSFEFISQRAKTVFITLASFSNKNNECFPSIATIADRSGLSESTVRRAIADLIAMEIVIKTANFRPNKACSSNIYTLINPLDYVKDSNDSTTINLTPAPCQSDTGEGVNMTPAIEYDNNINMIYSNENNVSQIKADSDFCEPQSCIDNPSDNSTDIKCKSDPVLDMILDNIRKSCNGKSKPCAECDSGMPNRDRDIHANTLSLSDASAVSDSGSDVDLNSVLRNCEFDFIRINYGDEFAVMLKNTVQRLFYSSQLKIGNVVLPQHVVRDNLKYLNYHTLESAIDKLKLNPKNRVTNSSSYLMVLLFNSITEIDIDWYVHKRH